MRARPNVVDGANAGDGDAASRRMSGSGRWALRLGGIRNVFYGAEMLIVLSMQGKIYVRGDSKIFRFQNGKSESLFLQRKNPRLIAWTTLYRRQHRKGISEV